MRWQQNIRALVLEDNTRSTAQETQQANANFCVEEQTESEHPGHDADCLFVIRVKNLKLEQTV